MKWPFVSRRRYEADLDAVKADRERIRGERDQFKQDRDAQRTTATTAARQFDDAGSVIACLTADLAAARERLAEVEAASCDTAAAHWSAQARREKKRADRLQARLDDAVGLTDPRVEDGRNWQQNRQDGGRKLGAEA